MTREKAITERLEANVNLIAFYQQQKAEFQKQFDKNPVEVSKTITSFDRQIKRLEREQKLLNKELSLIIEKPPEGDRNYVYQEGDEKRRTKK